MNSEYYIAQRKMHPIKIKQEVGYNGPHEQIIYVGGDLHILFQDGGGGIFWMNPQDRVATKLIQYGEP